MAGATTQASAPMGRAAAAQTANTPARVYWDGSRGSVARPTSGPGGAGALRSGEAGLVSSTDVTKPAGLLLLDDCMATPSLVTGTPAGSPSIHDCGDGSDARCGGAVGASSRGG